MKTLQRLVLSLLSGILIAGCSAPTPPATPTPEVVVVTTTPKIVVITNTPTPTSTPRPSPTSRPSPTPKPQSPFGEDCWDIRDTFSDENIPIDRLVLKPWEPGSQIFIVNFQDGTKIGFPEEEVNLINIYVSPNGKWLAGKDIDLDRLFIIDTNGKTVSIFPFHSRWGGISRWINDNTILIMEDDNYPLNTLFAFDPFTQKEIELPHLFPEINFLQSQPWPWSGLTSYDSTLQFVIYPELSMEGNFLVLWDLKKNGPILRLNDVAPFLMPIWSPDGKKFVVTGLFRYPLTVISLDMTIKHSLIKLDKEYMSIIETISWSPDGRYLAFWLEPKTGPYNNLHLMIWDTLEDRVTDTCITAGHGIPSVYINTPFWSLDGKFLAVSVIKPGDQHKKMLNRWDVFVVDPEGKFAVKIAENTIPFGWVVR